MTSSTRAQATRFATAPRASGSPSERHLATPSSERHVAQDGLGGVAMLLALAGHGVGNLPMAGVMALPSALTRFG